MESGRTHCSLCGKVKTLTKSRTTNWPGSLPAVTAACRGLQLSSLTLLRCQHKSCFYSEFLCSHQDARAALTHFAIHFPGARLSYAKRYPNLPARRRHVPGLPFHRKSRDDRQGNGHLGDLRGLQAADESSTVYFQTLSPRSHVLSRAASQLLSVSGVISSLLEGKELFPWKGRTRTECDF